MVEMPHQSTRKEIDDPLYHGLRGKVPVVRKITEDPAQAAAMLAKLHCRSVAPMRINNCSNQDLHIFGDPLRIPIVLVERVVNSPLCSAGSYFRNMDTKDTNGMLPEIDSSVSRNQH